MKRDEFIEALYCLLEKRRKKLSDESFERRLSVEFNMFRERQQEKNKKEYASLRSCSEGQRRILESRARRNMWKPSKFYRTDCEYIVDTVFKIIADELAGHGSIRIPNFGLFYVEDKSARTYKNPLTGEETFVDTRKYPKFKSADALKDAVK